MRSTWPCSTRREHPGAAAIRLPQPAQPRPHHQLSYSLELNNAWLDARSGAGTILVRAQDGHAARRRKSILAQPPSGCLNLANCGSDPLWPMACAVDCCALAYQHAHNGCLPIVYGC